ncbi:N-acyl-L-amino acid amidohydrolase [Roseomonas mucosa]|uniref:amidohydrolase n=1 Tax=Roseomonas TaxID=125216 RepID=UPI000959DCCB|nr:MULTISPECIES: amidohydrolase [Roseomonas]ATR22268.1 amidohydrolase [Roseomonas sp. FDAARGOS_362]USQ73055.1 amidohydrolase [Roseomonas mucosa]UZO95208.1 N-acyl-L-amino acid amidohydrolase [Roseomonas mucosa]GAV35507.1 putative hydrolase YxeP [Roseomonas sp. TAS13]
MTETPLDAIKRFEDELIAIRRDIHAHPETRFEEHRTAALVATKLREWGIDEVTEGVGGTGVVGTLRGTRPGQRAIGLRADMDALFMEERTGLPHASTVPGKMHACGHDGHTAMLLGAAKYLSANRDFAGTVQLIFQPAEEAGTGAPAMIRDGLFERFPCDAVYGMHNSPGIPVGQFAIRPGPNLAGADFWGVTFTGTGGHGGAAPHLATDATVVLGHFLLGVHTIVARSLAPTEPAAVSVGHVHCGTPESPNVMPSRVLVRGTARYFEQRTQETIRRRLRDLAEGLAATYGVTAELEYQPLCIPTVNDVEKTGVARAAAGAVVGAAKVGEIPMSTGGEDFAFMLREKPGAFIRIGNGVNPDGSFHNVHTPLYDFNDEALAPGAAYWASLVRHELGWAGEEEARAA